MSSFELNKVLGAVLIAVLTMVVIGKIGDNLVTTGGGHGGGQDGGHGAEATVTAKAPAPKVKEPLEPVLGMLASADAAAGQKVAAKCRACHDVKQDGKNKIGPNLWNVVNARRGAVAGFAYSKALTEKPGAWSYESLNAFIAKPKDYIAGTKMSFAGITKVKDRANLIAYLRAAADSPAALPTQAEMDASAKMLEAAKNAAAAAAEPAAPAAEAAIKDVAQAAAKAEPVVAEMDIAQMLTSADPERGKKVFAKCKACHTVNKGGKNGIGPNLWNVVNAKHGMHEGFKYSKALEALSDKTWTYENLNAFLTKPKDYAKGTKMTFAGLKKDSDRAHLIAYLRSLSDSPAPLK